MEFATASLHNSFYFVEAKNIIKDRMMVGKEFENLVNELLKSKSPKKWFRAYFNHGLINYIFGQKRLLPCDMAFITFFLLTHMVMLCHVMVQKIKRLWVILMNVILGKNCGKASKQRKYVKMCASVKEIVGMIGSVSPAMKKYIWKPGFWVVKHKFLRYFKENKYSMFENKIVRDYRDGKVTKNELDKCSTCDMCSVINDGLSATSKEQFKNKSGEEIVDQDIASQMKKHSTTKK